MLKTPEAQTGSVLNGLYMDILTGISSGEYPLNSTLPTEDRLARDYGVSRSLVRSALDMLKKRGIVRSQQGSGTVVACCDPEKLVLPGFDEHLPDLQDCYTCRMAIEPEIAAQLSVHQSTSATAYLAAQLKELERHGRHGGHGDARPDDPGAASDADFHIRLAEYTQNSFFSSIMVAMRPHMLFSMNIKKHMTRAARKDHIDCSRLEHLKVIRAILDKNADGARSLMREHIANGRDRIFLEGPGQAGAGITRLD